MLTTPPFDAAFAGGHRIQRQHVGGGKAHHIEGADQVDLDQLAELIQRHRPLVGVDDVARMGAADAVHENAGGTVTGAGRLQRLLRCRGVGDVAWNGERARRLADRLDAVGVDIDGGDPGTRFDEGARGLRAETGCGAGHHRGAVPQIHVFIPSQR
jgi:hypothetical protein